VKKNKRGSRNPKRFRIVPGVSTMQYVIYRSHLKSYIALINRLKGEAIKFREKNELEVIERILKFMYQSSVLDETITRKNVLIGYENIEEAKNLIDGILRTVLNFSDRPPKELGRMILRRLLKDEYFKAALLSYSEKGE